MSINEPDITDQTWSKKDTTQIVVCILCTFWFAAAATIFCCIEYIA